MNALIMFGSGLMALFWGFRDYPTRSLLAVPVVVFVAELVMPSRPRASMGERLATGVLSGVLVGGGCLLPFILGRGLKHLF